jgi:hypothetical protein
MFGPFLHPTPVGRRREVAELSVRVVAPDAVDGAQVLRVRANHGGLVAPHLDPLPQPVSDSSIKFSVVYSRSEYLSFVNDQLAVLLAGRALAAGKEPTPTSLLTRGLVALVGSMFFAVKRRRMPVCSFVISARGLQRTTRLGIVFVPWSEVVAVHRHSQGYLVAERTGAMPLPYRCFDKEAAATFDSLVRVWRESGTMP